MTLQRNITLLFWFNFFSDLTFYAPVAIIYFAKVSGSFALGMSIFSIIMLSSAFFEIPTGIFSDMIGRKNTVILGALSSAISVAFYALGGSYKILVVGALIEGLGRSFYSGNNDALLHDTLKETGRVHQYHEYLGKISAMFQLGLAAAAVAGSIFANTSFALVMWVSLVPKTIALVLGLFLTEPKIHGSGSGNVFVHLHKAVYQFRKNKRLQFLSIASMIRYALGESAYLFRSAFINMLWPLWALGFATMFSNIGAFLGYFFAGKIIDKHKAEKVLWWEIIANRIINFTALFFPTIFSPALMGATSLSYGVGQVAMGTLLQKEFTQKQRATMGSLNSLLGSIGFGITAIILGYIGDIVGPIKALLIIHILLLSPLYFYRKIFMLTD